jgi:hypothetical protein
MPFTKASSSQNAHYDAVGCVMNVRGKPFGLLVSSESAVELLEFNTQRWWPLPNLFGGSGSNNNSVHNRTISEENSAEEGAKHSGASAVASLGSQVFQVGGLDTTNTNTSNYSSNTCHSLGFGDTAWQSLPEMNDKRCYPAAIGVGNDDEFSSTLYVLGGRDGWDQLNTVESFHVATQTWTTRANFATPRMAPAVVALSETTLLLVGGYTGKEWTTSVELYSVPSDSWNTDKQWKIPSVPVPLAFPKAVVVPGTNDNDEEEGNTTIDRILISGTSILKPGSGNSTYTVILSYHLKTSKWSKLVSGVTRRSGRVLLPSEGCAVVLDPDQSTLYTIGGRTSRQLEAASKQVLKWSLPSIQKDDAAWIQNLQPPLTSPRRSHRKTISTTGSVNSGIPFSTIQVDEDEGSMAGTILSSASQRIQGSHNRTRSSMNMLKNSSKSGSIMEEQDEEHVEETTTKKYPVEWTDARGIKGKYAGKIKNSDGTTPHGMGQFVCRETGDFYEGAWKHGKRHGYGRWKYGFTGDVFEGWFVDDKRQGRGTFQVSQIEWSYTALGEMITMRVLIHPSFICWL